VYQFGATTTHLAPARAASGVPHLPLPCPPAGRVLSPPSQRRTVPFPPLYRFIFLFCFKTDDVVVRVATGHLSPPRAAAAVPRLRPARCPAPRQIASPPLAVTSCALPPHCCLFFLLFCSETEDAVVRVATGHLALPRAAAAVRPLPLPCPQADRVPSPRNDARCPSPCMLLVFSHVLF
jgi:hypothetical protein